MLRELRVHVIEALSDERSTINIDETGFPKKGKKSAGVKRQYSETLGRVENCHNGVFANYYSEKAHVFMDRRINLPEEWAEGAERRK